MAKIYHFWMGVPYGTLTDSTLVLNQISRVVPDEKLVVPNRISLIEGCCLQGSY